jgi:hypothetical protein
VEASYTLGKWKLIVCTVTPCSAAVALEGVGAVAECDHQPTSITAKGGDSTYEFM